MLREGPPYRGGLCARDGVMIITEGDHGGLTVKAAIVIMGWVWYTLT